jgi:hypothetical protein
VSENLPRASTLTKSMRGKEELSSMMYQRSVTPLRGRKLAPRIVSVSVGPAISGSTARSGLLGGGWTTGVGGGGDVDGGGEGRSVVGGGLVVGGGGVESRW